MLGALVTRILAIAGNSSVEPIIFLRFPRAIVEGSGYIFALGSGIPISLNSGPFLRKCEPGSIYSVRRT